MMEVKILGKKAGQQWITCLQDHWPHPNRIPIQENYLSSGCLDGITGINLSMNQGLRLFSQDSQLIDALQELMFEGILLCLLVEFRDDTLNRDRIGVGKIGVSIELSSNLPQLCIYF